jgi:hypothetical protein
MKDLDSAMTRPYVRWSDCSSRYFLHSPNYGTAASTRRRKSQFVVGEELVAQESNVLPESLLEARRESADNTTTVHTGI